jgi:hypothetical protein
MLPVVLVEDASSRPRATQRYAPSAGRCRSGTTLKGVPGGTSAAAAPLPPAAAAPPGGVGPETAAGATGAPPAPAPSACRPRRPASPDAPLSGAELPVCGAPFADAARRPLTPCRPPAPAAGGAAAAAAAVAAAAAPRRGRSSSSGCLHRGPARPGSMRGCQGRRASGLPLRPLALWCSPEPRARATEQGVADGRCRSRRMCTALRQLMPVVDQVLSRVRSHIVVHPPERPCCHAPSGAGMRHYHRLRPGCCSSTVPRSHCLKR